MSNFEFLELVKEVFWDSRNLLGKLLFLPVWPPLIAVTLLFAFIDAVAELTRKKP